MKFLLPIGGIIDHRFGILTTPAHNGITAGIKAGMSWAADNQAFTKGFNPDVFFPWLEKMQPYRETCLFVACPDVVGSAVATAELFTYWRNQFNDWLVAFVAQDGQEDLDLPQPDLWDALFLGGSTAWKLSDAAQTCIIRAQKLGKHIHIGRVNYRKRYNHFASMEGSNEFTCDGTRTRYEKDKALIAWAEYMAAPRQPSLFIPSSHYLG